MSKDHPFKATTFYKLLRKKYGRQARRLGHVKINYDFVLMEWALSERADIT